MTITYLFLTLRPKQGYTRPYTEYTVAINTQYFLNMCAHIYIDIQEREDSRILLV